MPISRSRDAVEASLERGDEVRFGLRCESIRLGIVGNILYA